MDQKDLLLESFSNTHSVEEVLSLISRHHQFMRQKHAKMAFYALKVHVKSVDEIKSITESPEFDLLCKVTVKLIRTLNPKELLIIFSRLIDFNIEPATLIFQSTIQMLRHELNEMSTECLLILDRTLFYDIDQKHPADSDATVAALRIALPMVLEIRLKNNEFDAGDTASLVTFLRLALAKEMSADVTNNIVHLLQQQSDNLSFYQYQKVISSLMSHRARTLTGLDKDSIQELLTHCLNNFTRLVRGWEWKRNVEEVIVDLFRRSFEGTDYFCKDFLDLVVEAHLRRLPTTKDLVRLAKHLLPFHYVNQQLNQKICENLAHERLHVHFGGQVSIGVLQPLIHTADFEPACGWDRIIENLFDNDLMADAAVKSAFQYLKNLEAMALIGRYSEPYYSHLITALTTMTQRPVPLGTVGQRLLNIRIGLEHDEHDLPAAQVKAMIGQLEAFVQEAIRVLNPMRRTETASSSSLLRESLVRALGGEDFLRCGSWSKDGQYHDYIVVMRLGDYPVAIGKEVLELNFIDDIRLPENCKLSVSSSAPVHTLMLFLLAFCRLSIVPRTSSDFLREPPSLRRTSSFRMKMLQKSGFYTLSVDMPEFEAMPKREQIPYLMREVTNSIQERNQTIV